MFIRSKAWSCTGNISIWEAKAGGLTVQGQPGLPKESTSQNKTKITCWACLGSHTCQSWFDCLQPLFSFQGGRLPTRTTSWDIQDPWYMPVEQHQPGNNSPLITDTVLHSHKLGEMIKSPTIPCSNGNSCRYRTLPWDQCLGFSSAFMEQWESIFLWQCSPPIISLVSAPAH